MIKNLSIILPTFHCRDLISICIKSFEKFRPNGLCVKYVVIENSSDVSYKGEITSLSKNVEWENNIVNYPSDMGSFSNASGLEKGLKYIDSEWVFLAHCDICVTSNLFFVNMFSKMEDDNYLIGTVLDPSKERIGAVHISGLMVKTDIAKDVNLYPKKIENKVIDVGDELTLYCRKNFIKHYCFRNTFNDKRLESVVEYKYNKFYADRCINDDNKVIFMHLGRGIPKTNGSYKKEGKTSLKEWVNFCEKIISD